MWCCRHKNPYATLAVPTSHILIFALVALFTRKVIPLKAGITCSTVIFIVIQCQCAHCTIPYSLLLQVFCHPLHCMPGRCLAVLLYCLETHVEDSSLWGSCLKLSTSDHCVVLSQHAVFGVLVMSEAFNK